VSVVHTLMRAPSPCSWLAITYQGWYGWERCAHLKKGSLTVQLACDYEPRYVWVGVLPCAPCVTCALCDVWRMGHATEHSVRPTGSAAHWAGLPCQRI
jgi:hypothetical protein